MGLPNGQRGMRMMRSFVRCEDGSATIWNLTWLTGIVVMAGLTIDSTNARRVHTMMASTADVAALAGVMELPMPHLGVPYSAALEPPVEAAAIGFAQQNMTVAEHGAFIETSDVFVGSWDPKTRTFTWGPTPPKQVNAVQVWLGRNEDKSNRLATTLLRTIGATHWDINTTATAVAGIPDCYQNAIIAEGELFMTSNNKVYSGVCLHGQSGFSILNNNWWWPDTTVSHGVDTDATFGPNQKDSTGQDGPPPPVVIQNQHPSAMVYDVVNVGRAMLDLDGALQAAHGYNPDYELMRLSEMQNPADGPVIEMDTFTIGDTVAETADAGTVQVAALGSLGGLAAAGGNGNGNGGNGNGGNGNGGGNGGGSCVSSATHYQLQDMRSGFDQTTCPGASLTEGRTYYAACDNKLTISGVVRNVVIVSECRVTMANNAALENVMLVVLGESGGGKSFDTANNSRFGRDDNCAEGGGVRIWTSGDFHVAGNAEWHTAQIYVGGDLHFAAKSDSRGGISAHVAGDAHVSAQAEVAGIHTYPDVLAEDEGGPACLGDVQWDWITTDYHYVLVD